MVTSNPFLALFGRSPFQPLLEHIDKTVECADLLPLFFEATLSGDWARASEIRDRISEAEHVADELKARIRTSLPNSLFLPVSRSDLLELISVQDKIANRIKDIAGIMLGRQMRVPEAMEDVFRAYLDIAVATVHQARGALAELDDLLASGFGRNVSDRAERVGSRLQILLAR